MVQLERRCVLYYLSHSCRTLNTQREAQLRKMINMGRRRSSHTHTAVAAAPAAAVTATDSVSPALDSGATSPDVIPGAAEETRTASIEVTVGEAVPPPTDNGESCAEPRSNSRGSRSCSYRLRRGQKDGAERDGSGNRPAGVHIRHHGRGGNKEKGWRSMHMVQCLQYHEVRAGVVWFSRRCRTLNGVHCRR